jgi:hypothetical protein
MHTTFQGELIKQKVGGGLKGPNIHQTSKFGSFHFALPLIKCCQTSLKQWLWFEE